jgi:two-component system cell cycle sensor histidine kinase/response regulator CckA
VPAAPIPENERARLAALRRYAVLDTPTEDNFDRFTRLASSILGTPIAIISLIDESHQWFKSAVGLNYDSTPRAESFCAHTILGTDVVVVPDASVDARFRDNPHVVMVGGVRFYAAAPLTTPDGFRIGTLSVVDHVARPAGLTALQQQQLRDLAALVIDQLELRRKTAELEASRTQLELASMATRASLDAILITRAEPIQGPDGPEVIYCNEAFTKLTGYEPDEIIGRTPRLLQGPDTDQGALTRIREHLQAWRPVRQELLNYRQDGTAFWTELNIVPVADAAGRYTHWVSVQRDTTERHAQMDALTESEQRYRLLFHDNPQPMWVYDSETLAFLDVNAAAESMYGYTRAEFLSKTVLDIRPSEEAEHVRQAAARVPDGIARSGPWRHLRKDGRLLFVRISSYPTRYEGRRARLVLAHDITAEKELEEQLVQAQKMEAVGQLAGGVAHDFNNLLTVINGYAQLLMSRLHDADPLRVDTSHILQAGERAATLTQQLLAFSRRQVLQPRPLDVGGVIETLRPMLGRLLREDIDVRTSLPPTLPPVMVDPVQLEQVLLNLAINGSDAMPDGGTLSISAGEADVDAEAAERHGMSEGRYVTVSVADTGVGMDEDTRGRIFEPFFTTKAKGRGSGLGLPVAYGIVKQSGGSIVVQTKPDEGSTFTVYLPLAEAPMVEEEQTPPADVSRLSGHETVLVVEDHEAVRRLAADVLRAHGYQVLVAEHGMEAIALVEARGGKIDLLLTDVIMPRMSGREVATALQQRVPDLGVLFMSGYTQTAIVQNGALESGLHFLAKPFTPAELLARVREVLAARTAAAASTQPTTTATPTMPPTRESSPATPARRRIVVADDEPGLRLLLAATLSGAGYEVLQASNGLEAVRLCEGGRVDLLLTDLVMPDHEGLETIRRMRAERPDIPVVAMSGAFDGGFLEVARAMGAAAVIQKPFTPDQVVKVVARVLDERVTPSSR